MNTGKLQLYTTVLDGAEPAIVLEAGGGADSSSWKSLPAQLARATRRRVVTYDRAGFGKSPMPVDSFTVDDELDALRTALRQLGVKRVVFVAESYGAMLVLGYTLRNPAHVAGLVFVDPMNADFVNAVGLERLSRTVPHIESPKSDRERAIHRLVNTMPGLAASLTGKRWPETVPAVIITAGIPWWDDEAMRAPWRASHETLASATGARLVIAERSKHDISQTQPDLVIDAVRSVLARATPRTGTVPTQSRQARLALPSPRQ